MPPCLPRLFRLKAAWLAAALALCTALTPVRAAAADKIIFQPLPAGPAASLVNKAWMAEPDYKEYVGMLHMPPDYMLGLADVNGDGAAEIFARHSDDELGFCDDKGFACRMHIYVYVNGQTIEIGRMMAGEPVIVLDTKNMGIRDLLVVDSSHKRQVYRWNGKQYAFFAAESDAQKKQNKRTGKAP